MSDNFSVVISGISGRFPECQNADEFKEKLYNKENMVTVDDRKWPSDYEYKDGDVQIPAATGKYLNVTHCDGRYFQISAVLLDCTDVLTRMVLEPAVEAIFDAGINPLSLSGSNTGVYMACGISEADASYSIETLSKTMMMIGSSKTMVSNRISFSLNLKGPSFTTYASFQGSLQVLSLAYKHISNGTIDSALVGVSSFISDPRLSVHFSQLGFLSPDGVTRAFDENANGYGRSEAVVVLFLQRAHEAKRIYGNILHSESIYLGSQNKTYMNISEDSLKDSFSRIYANCDINPLEISYLETNTCGVKWLDEEELNVVTDMFCENRNSALLVGSVKSNVGHTEGSAYFVSIAKALFALDSGYIAPNINFEKPDLRVKGFANNKLKVVCEKTSLPGSVVGVSCIGAPGIVSHSIYSQHSKEPRKSKKHDLPRLVLLFGRSEDGVKEAMKKVESVPFNQDFISLVNDVFSVNMISQMFRGYTIVPPIPSPTNGFGIVSGDKRPVWFLFSGMGSQWNGMGQDLLKIPIFAAAIDKIDAFMKDENVNVREILTSKDPELFDNIANAFVGIAAIQVGLVDILCALDIKPDGIIGHSVGETGCAYADGCFTAEQTVLSAYSRGLASLKIETVKGMMAAVGVGYNELKDTLPEGIEVACHNSSTSCTITGPVEDVNQFVGTLKEKNIFAKVVNVANIAYHSKHIAPAGPVLLEYLKKVIPNPKRRSSKWISTSVPESMWDTETAQYSSAEYHTNNLVSSVLFEEGCKHIPSNAIIIEIAPHGLMQAIVKRAVDPECINIPLTNRLASDGVNFLLSAIGKLYLAGCQPNVNTLYPKVEYPVPRGTPSVAPLVSWDHSDKWDIPSKTNQHLRVDNEVCLRITKGSKLCYLNSHRACGLTVIPPSFYLFLTWKTFSSIKNKKMHNLSVTFENVRVYTDISVTPEQIESISVLIQKGSGSFEVVLNDSEEENNVQLILSGVIHEPFDKEDSSLLDKNGRCLDHRLNKSEFNALIKSAGYELNGVFDILQEVTYSNTECFGKIIWNGNWVAFLDILTKMYMYTEPEIRMEPVRFHYILKIVICPKQFQSLNTGDSVFCYKNNSTRQLECSGLKIAGFNYKPVSAPFAANKCDGHRFEGYKFVPHIEPGIWDEKQFITLCLQICIENVSFTMSRTSDKLYIVDTGPSAIITKIRDICKFDPVLNKKIKFIKSAKLTSISREQRKNEKCYLFVDTDAHQFLKFDNYDLQNVFILMNTSRSHLKLQEDVVVVIAKQSFEDSVLLLSKKVPKKNDRLPKVLHIDENWKTISEQLMTEPISRDPLLVVWDRNEIIDFSTILMKINSFPALVRFIIILDETAPPFCAEHPFYRNQIHRNLRISVFKNGSWGSYRTIDIFDNEQVHRCRLKNMFEELRLETLNIEYISVGSYNINQSITDRTEYGLEYAGITKHGERLMGLMRYNSADSSIELDGSLVWKIPSNWTMEDAATVPFAYAQAYYVLYYLPIRKESKTALIHRGDTVFGEVCITLLLKDGFEVFTTVTNEDNAILLKNKFPGLKETNMFLNTNYSYDVRLLMLTKGNGVSVVVNSLTGIKHLEASMNCVGKFGQYIEVNQDNSRKNLDLGMYVFLRCVSCFVVPNTIPFVLNLNSNEKNTLSLLIKEGIRSGVVKPLKRDVYNQNEIERCNMYCEERRQILKYCNEENKLQKLHFDGDRSYIIIGGGKNGNLWYNVMEWLIEKGARKFLVALDKLSTGPKISCELNKLITEKGITVVLTSLEKLSNVQEATNFIADANHLSPLEAIFFTHPNLSRSMLRNMDEVLRKEYRQCHFISMSGGGLAVCERRRSDGLSAIVLNKSTSVTNLFSYLDKALVEHNILNLPALLTLVKNDDCSDVNQIPLLSEYLPSDFNALNCRLEQTARFEEVGSLSSSLSSCDKVIYPVFIIPAISPGRLVSLTRKLHYPTFCAHFPTDCASCCDIAFSLFQDVKRIQPEGPLTIVGELWSCCIAIELALLAQSIRRNVKLLLIEGTLSLWKEIVLSLGEPNTNSFNRNLLEQAFALNGLVKPINNDTNNNKLASWDQSLDAYLSNIKDETMKQNVISRLNNLRNMLTTLSSYTPSAEFRGTVVYLKRQSIAEFDLQQEKYCVSADVCTFEHETYDEFLKNSALHRTLNENALFSWGFPKSV